MSAHVRVERVGEELRYRIDSALAGEVERAVVELLDRFPAARIVDQPDRIDSRWAAVVGRPVEPGDLP